jgi:hypothetical protein
VAVRSFLRHPIVIASLVAAFSALVIPQITREWQDRKLEQELKQSLLEEISNSSTTAVRQGISLVNGQIRAAGGENGENTTQVYATLRNSWLIKRATARSRIIVYFPDLYACWYSYERAVSDYLSLSSGDKKTYPGRVMDLRRYVSADFANSYVEPDAPDGCAPLTDLPEVVQSRLAKLKDVTHWPALNYSTDNPDFREVYAEVGEALIIGMERIIETIVKTPARGFSHGI